MIIREGNAADADAVYGMICDMEGKRLPRGSFDRIYAEQVADRDHHRFIIADAGDDAGPVGVLHLRMEDQLHHAGRIAEIMELAVASGHRDAGLGSKIFARACEIARDAGCLQIEVACNQLRHDAHRFYQRQGMHNFHYKFSLPLAGEDSGENVLGR